jgi:hypothetical protein
MERDHAVKVQEQVEEWAVAGDGEEWEETVQALVLVVR